MKRAHFASIPSSLSLPLFSGVLHPPPALRSPRLMSVWWHNCLICEVSLDVWAGAHGPPHLRFLAFFPPKPLHHTHTFTSTPTKIINPAQTTKKRPFSFTAHSNTTEECTYVAPPTKCAIKQSRAALHWEGLPSLHMQPHICTYTFCCSGGPRVAKCLTPIFSVTMMSLSSSVFNVHMGVCVCGPRVFFFSFFF